MRSNRLLGALAVAGLSVFVSAGSAMAQVVVQLPHPVVYVAPPPPPPAVVFVAPQPTVYVEPPRAEVVVYRGRRSHGHWHGRGHGRD